MKTDDDTFESIGQVAERVVRNTQVKICAHCNVSFPKNRSGKRWEETRFCSSVCFGLAKRNDPKKVLQENSEPGQAGCLIWNGPKTDDGYGRFTVGGKWVGAHRAAYELAFGPIGDGLGVLHRCDNRACLNPDHLFLGTNAENVADMVNKSRQAIGTKINTAKLSPDDVVAIRKSPLSERQAAIQFGVAKSQVGRIRRRESWPHIS